MLKPSHIITITTLTTFILGILPFIYPSIFISLLTFCLALILSDMVPKFNHMKQRQLFKCLITTYIFGLINGYYLTLDKWDPFGILLCLHTVRYYGQFQLINNYHHHLLQWQSFLIYHSKMYFITNILLIIEHIITRHIFHFEYKQYHSLMIPAFILTILAIFIRIIAFFTAKSNFTHKIAYQKVATHKLVQNGIYSILRHPSYTGFFYYTVFSMIFIGNWLSAILFGLMLSVFFEDRIQYEQNLLIKFFGKQYKQYMNKTYVLIPYLPPKITDAIMKLY